MPTTLSDLRKAKFPDIKNFAKLWEISLWYNANTLLEGRFHRHLTPEDTQRLAGILGISFEDCVKAANTTFRQKFSGNATVMAASDLDARWHREQCLRDGTYWRTMPKHIGPSPRNEALTYLGLTLSATEGDILKAFRDRVKAMTDGKGGYNGDMDALVQAKEKALALARG